MHKENEKNVKSLAVETRALERVFDNGFNQVRALREIDLRFETGSFVAVKGRSGSGKTTLLNCIGGLDRPTAGEVLIHGQSLRKLSDNALTEFRRQEVGFIFQAFGLLPTLSAFENVELMLRIGGMPRKERNIRAMEVLDMVGLLKWAQNRPSEMSGGQAQRVAIARAIGIRPRLILADEPTGELDSETAVDVLSLFRAIVRTEGVTMLMASHDALVDTYVDRIVLLDDGRLIEDSG